MSWTSVSADLIALRDSLPEHLRVVFDQNTAAVMQEMTRIRIQHPAPPVVRRPQHSGWHYVDVEHDGVLWKWGERAGGTVGSRGWELFEAIDVVTGKAASDEAARNGASRAQALAKAKAASEAYDEAPKAAPATPEPSKIEDRYHAAPPVSSADERRIAAWITEQLPAVGFIRQRKDKDREVVEIDGMLFQFAWSARKLDGKNYVRAGIMPLGKAARDTLGTGAWVAHLGPVDDAGHVKVVLQALRNRMKPPQIEATAVKDYTTRAAGIARGRAAFAEKRPRVPYHDPYLRDAYTKGPIPMVEYIDGWLRGWDDANIEANRAPEPEPPDLRQINEALVSLGTGWSWSRSGSYVEIAIRGGTEGGALNPRGERILTAEQHGSLLTAETGLGEPLAKVEYDGRQSALDLAKALDAAVAALPGGQRRPSPEPDGWAIIVKAAEKGEPWDELVRKAGLFGIDARRLYELRPEGSRSSASDQRERWAALFPLGSYLNRFFAEKVVPEREFSVTDSKGLDHHIPNEVVVEAIAQTQGAERKKIEDTLRQIDFRNGDVNHYLEFLAKGLAEGYEGAFREGPVPPPAEPEPTLRDAAISLPPGWVAEYIEGRETWLIENEADSNEQVKLRYWSKPEPHYYVTSAKESNRHLIGASPSDTVAVKAEKNAAARAAALADVVRMVTAFERARRSRPLTSGDRVWITDVLDESVLHEANFRGHHEGKVVVVMTKTGMQLSVDPSRIRREGPVPPSAEPERIVGGRADGRRPEEFDQNALARGTAIEREHTDDPIKAREIAMDHLAEHPDYYDEKRGLPAMEERLAADERKARRTSAKTPSPTLDQQIAASPVSKEKEKVLGEVVERVVESHFEGEHDDRGLLYLTYDDGERTRRWRLFWNAGQVDDAIYLRLTLKPKQGPPVASVTGEVDEGDGVEVEEQVHALMEKLLDAAIGGDPEPPPAKATPPRTAPPTAAARPGQVWSDPSFDDPGVSTAVSIEYLPAADVDPERRYAVTWYGTPAGPEDRGDPYFASPIERDFESLAKAKQAVEREFAKRNPEAAARAAEGDLSVRERNALRWIALGNDPSPAMLKREPPKNESLIGKLKRLGLVRGDRELTVTPAGEDVLASASGGVVRESKAKVGSSRKASGWVVAAERLPQDYRVLLADLLERERGFEPEAANAAVRRGQQIPVEVRPFRQVWSDLLSIYACPPNLSTVDDLELCPDWDDRGPEHVLDLKSVLSEVLAGVPDEPDAIVRAFLGGGSDVNLPPLMYFGQEWLDGRHRTLALKLLGGVSWVPVVDIGKIAGGSNPASRKASAKPQAGRDAGAFLGHYQHRDALMGKGLGNLHPDQITAQMVEEVMWEEGYENAPFPAQLEAWMRSIGADGRKAWEDGRAAAGGSALRKLPAAKGRRQRLKEAAIAGAHGKDWYQKAQREIEVVSKAWGVAPEAVAVAVAATSPATAVVLSPRMKKGGGRGSNIGKARTVVKRLVLQGVGSEALHPKTPGLSRLHEFERCAREGLGAPACVQVAFPTPDRVKTHAFVRNLLGDGEAVTVDRHLARVATGGKTTEISPAQYEQIVADVRAVARELGWEPRQVMAAVWTAAGGTGELQLATAAERQRVGRGRHAEARVALRRQRDGGVVLYHGSPIENLRGILGQGLRPGAGISPHQTKTTTATFFTDDQSAALLYATARGVVLEIDVEGLDLHPDYDDASYVLDAVQELNRTLGADLRLGDPIPEELVDAVEEYLQEVSDAAESHLDAPLTTDVEDGQLVLAAEPLVGIPIDGSAYHDDPELYEHDRIRRSDWGAVRFYANQYLCSCSVPPERIRRVFVPEDLLLSPWPGPWRGITNYDKVVEDTDEDTGETRFTFPTVRCAAMTLDQARAMFGTTAAAPAASAPPAAYVDEGMVGEHWGTRGSGILFVTTAEGSAPRVLLVKRAPGTQTPNVWSIPGGAIPRDADGGYRDAFESALAEAREEVGYSGVPVPYGEVDWQAPGSQFRYKTFLVEVPAAFRPKLQWEHTDARWVTFDEASALPLHPGLRAVWDEIRLSATLS